MLAQALGVAQSPDAADVQARARAAAQAEAMAQARAQLLKGASEQPRPAESQHGANKVRALCHRIWRRR